MMNFGGTASVSICIGILWSQMRLVLGTWEWEIFGFQCNGAYYNGVCPRVPVRPFSRIELESS